MSKSKIASLVLAGIMTIGGSGVTAFAAEAPTAPEQPSISISFDKEAKSDELVVKKATIDERKLEMTAKGEGVEAIKAKFKLKLMEDGKTAEEIAAILEKMSAKFEELKAAKMVDIDAKQAEREANQAERAEKGIVKGNKAN